MLILSSIFCNDLVEVKGMPTLVVRKLATLAALSVALVIFLVACGSPEPPAPQTYTVSGVVQSFAGVPEPGITVVLGDQSVQTGANGKWEFPNLLVRTSLL